MEIKTNPLSRRAGLTLTEVMIAISVGAIVGVAVGLLVFFTARSFVALSNYVDLDQKSRNALDRMSREIRQADRVLAFSTNSVSLLYNGGTLAFTFDPGNRTLSRAYNGQTEVLLPECDQLNFSVFQRNPVVGTYDQYPTASATTAKLVQFNWTCSRTILGQRVNTESMQSAKIVIRKQEEI